MKLNCRVPFFGVDILDSKKMSLSIYITVVSHHILDTRSYNASWGDRLNFENGFIRFEMIRPTLASSSSLWDSYDVKAVCRQSLMLPWLVCFDLAWVFTKIPNVEI